MKFLSGYIKLLTLWLTQLTAALASTGDRTWIFQKCIWNCQGTQCAGVSDVVYASQQPFYLRWLKWTCADECNYMCMWKAVEAYEMDHSRVPQFYGKWPFVRLFGIQEPASVIFSFLNGMTHIIMLLIFRRRVPSAAPMYILWHVYAVIAINAWFWAVVFHARDFRFTEMMDYVSAVALVMYSMFALCARVLGERYKLGVILCGALLFTFYVYHTYYLAVIKFDYGYNMKVNIAVGLLNVTGWVYWCYQVKHRQHYVWKAALSVVLVSALVLLEVWDFPPIFWTFDAHALWHAGTSPVPILWYSFLIDDCLYLLQQKKSVSNGKKST